MTTTSVSSATPLADKVSAALDSGDESAVLSLTDAAPETPRDRFMTLLATNYWDEMGDGDPDAVHTTLHERLVDAIAMPRIPMSEQPVSALARAAFGGLLATNRWLQPEMLGALGLIELQAGPRCRLVLQ